MKTLIIIVAIFGVLALTNPDKTQYANFLRETFNKDLQAAPDSFGKGILSFFTGPASQNVADISDRHNCIFFSLYESTINNKRVFVIGAVKSFYPLNDMGFTTNKTEQIKKHIPSDVKPPL